MLNRVRPARRHVSVWTFAACAALLACGRTPQPAFVGIDEPPDVTVARFEDASTRGHGIAMLSPDDRVRLKQMRANPAPYIDVIRREYAPGTVAPLALSRDQATRFMASSLVLTGVWDREAVRLLAAWWLELDAARANPGFAGATYVLDHMDHAVLMDLGDRYEESVVDRILETLPEMDRRRMNDCMNYLMRSSAGMPHVNARLRALYESADFAAVPRSRPAAPAESPGCVTLSARGA